MQLPGLCGLSACQVISSQMKWWLTSPFLSRVRWHVLLDCVNVWLFHFLATHPSCGLCYGVDGKRGLSIFAICCRIFFWFNKLMGFTITKTLRLTIASKTFFFHLVIHWRVGLRLPLFTCSAIRSRTHLTMLETFLHLKFGLSYVKVGFGSFGICDLQPCKFSFAVGPIDVTD